MRVNILKSFMKLSLYILCGLKSRRVVLVEFMPDVCGNAMPLICFYGSRFFNL